MENKSLQIRGAWKKLKLKASDVDATEDNFDDLACIEEVTDYEIVDGESFYNISHETTIAESSRKKAPKHAVELPEFDATEKVRSKKQKSRVNRRTNDTNEVESGRSRRLGKRKRKKATDVPQREIVEIGMANTVISGSAECDMSAWEQLFVPEPVLRALQTMAFSVPTPIQAMTLPSAIRDQLDIIGAAETGSGKTLAFGIPIIHHILESREDEMCEKEEEQEASKEILDSSDESLCGLEDSSVGCVKVIKDANFDFAESNSRELHPSPELIAKLCKDDEKKNSLNRKLFALVLAPTRELVVQVKNHLRNVAQYTDIRVVSVIGGVSIEKQLRLLQKKPEIIVATPGRLWELYQKGEPHLQQLMKIKVLVIDEADRMVEKGHFAELSNILEVINDNEENRKKRQTLVFSATLTLVHLGPLRPMLHGQKEKKTVTEKLNSLMHQIGIKEKRKVIDLSGKSLTAEKIQESCINCSKEDKDLFMYYFLLRYQGRTLVFCNSIDCVRRLAAVFSLLQCSPRPLHASMHQRQRLKNIERFQAEENGLLIATDVAARGLDIPNVKHVIHYQVPKTSESYVHRSGRTARAHQDGLSLIMISPDENVYYKRLCKTLNKVNALPTFPVDRKYLPAVQQRLKLALQLDKLEHQQRKQSSKADWFVRNAEAMDIDLDDDLLPSVRDSDEVARSKKQIKSIRKQLNDVLRKPVFPLHYLKSYPTMHGELHLPTIVGERTDTSAVAAVAKERNLQQKLIEQIAHADAQKKRKSRKFQEKKKLRKMKARK